MGSKHLFPQLLKQQPCNPTWRSGPEPRTRKAKSPSKRPGSESYPPSEFDHMGPTEREVWENHHLQICRTSGGDVNFLEGSWFLVGPNLDGKMSLEGPSVRST